MLNTNAKSIRISMGKYLIECLLACFVHKIYFCWFCLSEHNIHGM